MNQLMLGMRELFPWLGMRHPPRLYRFWFLSLTTPTVPIFLALSELYDAWMRFEQEKYARLLLFSEQHNLRTHQTILRRASSPLSWADRYRLSLRTSRSILIFSMIANAIPVLVQQVVLPLLGYVIPALVYAAPEGSTVVNAANAGLASRVAGAFVYGMLLSFTAMAGFEMASFMRNLSARLLGGQGHLSRIKFVTAAYVVPLAMIAGFFRTVPVVGLIILGVRSVYGAILSVPAIRAAYGLRSWDAVLSAIVGLLPGAVVMAGVARFYLEFVV